MPGSQLPCVLPDFAFFGPLPGVHLSRNGAHIMWIFRDYTRSSLRDYVGVFYVIFVILLMFLFFQCTVNEPWHGHALSDHLHLVTGHAQWEPWELIPMPGKSGLRSYSMAENLEVPMTSADGHEGMTDGDTFKIHLLESLGDEAIANKLHSIFAPSLDRLTKAVNDLVQTN